MLYCPDKRIPATVLAIVEDGEIDINDFILTDSLLTQEKMQKLYPNFKFYNDSIKDCYVASLQDDHLAVNKMIYSYAAAYADFPCDNELNNSDSDRHHSGQKYLDRIIDYDCGGGSGSTPVYERVVGSWKTLEEVPTLVRTKWNQSYPFDKFSPNRRKYVICGPSGRAPAGCVPIAIAQILTALKYPHNWKINGILVDWDKLGDFRTTKRWEEGTDYIDYIAGSVLRFIGLSVDAWYFYNATFAFPSNAKQFFKDWDFENVNRFWCGKEEHTIEALKKGAPVFISSISGWVNGHAWVIDGYRIQQREIKTINPSNSEVVATEKESRTLVHCNFGWRGIADGYYYFGVFNTKSGPVEVDKQVDPKELKKGDCDFTWHTSVITFDNPNKR
ncbi:C10 family peptidase [Porphyromonas sp.]|uniref:C10 family peptidase n=1 Tax=Porphyromonas sp. TaxID=1924944 RepID=UPI0026DCAACB|nr:C10 family peptidase [Porphyromonas sp.]MDO4770891.1 C10 family peptidase [Porphyromonas sp.]